MRPPSVSELRRLANTVGMSLSDADLSALANLCAELVPAYDCLDRLEPARLPVTYPRDKGRPPAPSPALRELRKPLINLVFPDPKQPEAGHGKAES